MDAPFYNDSLLSLQDVPALVRGDVYRRGTFENLGMFRSFGRNLLTVFYDERFRVQFDSNADRFSAVVTTPDLAPTIPDRLAVLVDDHPLDLFLRLHEALSAGEASFYTTAPRPTIISPDARIHPSAVIAEHDVIIEAGVVVDAFALIEPRTVVRSGSFIGPHVVLGGLGFEARRLDGEVRCLSHSGGVTIGADCHLLAHTAVARAMFGGATTIGARSKLDQFVHVAHAAVLGEECRLASCAAIAGTTRLGRGVWVGPSAIVGNSLQIGDGASVALGATVVQDVPDGGRVGGPFSRAMPR